MSRSKLLSSSAFVLGLLIVSPAWAGSTVDCVSGADSGSTECGILSTTGTSVLSTAVGYSATATGNQSTATGAMAVANGAQGVAVGFNSQANQTYTTAIGYESFSTSENATAVG